MNRALTRSKLVASALLVAVPALGLPVSVAGAPTSLSGVVVSSAERAPVAGARVHVADAASGSIVSAAATDDRGRFRLDELPASSYELAIEVDGGLYLVDSRVALAPGQAREVDLAIDDRRPGARIDAKAGGSALVSAWNNPGMATLVILGGAFLVGALVEDAIDDEETTAPASKFTPN